MLRSALLYLSGAEWAKAFITNFFVARRVARRFIAGETLEETLPSIEKLNVQGMDVTLDFLGESVESEQDAEQAAGQYLDMLDTIHAHNLRATVSLKLTQLGLDISEDICITNMRRILEKAAATQNHVTIDMESSDYTERTLRVFRTLREDYGFQNVGTVIQAYLYRSKTDMEALQQEGAFVRLCKGAYKEPPDVAFPDKADVDTSFVEIMKAYVSGSAAETGAYLGVATHDARIINIMRDYARTAGISNDRFEFQMLYGIRSDLQRELANAGYTMRIYVPYGTQWYPYFMRRLAERPANLWFFISNFFKG
ncbi:MAG: proline dehydrogenase family protein [Anaerolineae bacterium]|nr:proline dehydrogenase family protein [Anaerolineae bacterium]